MYNIIIVIVAVNEERKGGADAIINATEYRAGNRNRIGSCLLKFSGAIYRSYRSAVNFERALRERDATRRKRRKVKGVAGVWIIYECVSSRIQSIF